MFKSLTPLRNRHGLKSPSDRFHSIKPFNLRPFEKPECRFPQRPPTQVRQEITPPSVIVPPSIGTTPVNGRDRS